MIAGRRTKDVDVVPILIDLLRSTAHQRHEEVARWLQDLRDPRSIDALYVTASTRYVYLEHDDSHALARKCTWALADIGTVEAREKLRLLAANADSEIAGYAQKRLDNWTAETARKWQPPKTGPYRQRS